MLRDDKYCPRCAAPLGPIKIEGRDRPACNRCGKVLYYDPKVVASAVVERGGKVLMVRRGLEPRIGYWSLPGGYVDRGEVVERAAEREVLEETGLEVEPIGLIGIFSEPDHPVILVIYDSRIVGGTPRPGSEVLELEFFPLDDLPPLAFPRDQQVLEAWKRRRDGYGSS